MMKNVDSLFSEINIGLQINLQFIYLFLASWIVMACWKFYLESLRVLDHDKPSVSYCDGLGLVLDDEAVRWY